MLVHSTAAVATFAHEDDTLLIDLPPHIVDPSVGGPFVLAVHYDIVPSTLLDIGVFTFFEGSGAIDECVDEYPFGIATQLEPYHSGCAYPCWDHPLCKARYRLRVLCPQPLKVIANAAVHACFDAPAEDMAEDYPQPVLPQQERKIGAQKWWVFEETIPLPPYVVGFWICDFFSAQVPFDSERVLSVNCYRENQLASCDFALQLTLRAWGFFEELFGVRVPTTKMDLVALPRLHGLGMENFAAMTFRDEYLLVDERTSYTRRRRIARLLCHEMSHMYWGNLVTLTSFDELWLKEGMARFFEYVAAQGIDPTYELWLNFLTDVYLEALRHDGKSDTHPVVQEHNDDVTAIMAAFDVITYGKGACLLRMLHLHLGHDVFVAGMRTYVQRYMYDNASMYDLWAALQSAAGPQVSVADIMMPWLLQPGYPVLRVALAPPGTPATAIEDTVTLVLTQSPCNATLDSKIQRWPLPLIVRVLYANVDGMFGVEEHRFDCMLPC
jgi:aminopeptidase N